MSSKLTAVLATSLALAVTGCAGVTDPAGVESRDVASLWWLMFGLASLAVLTVVVLVGVAWLRSRRVLDADADFRLRSLGSTRGRSVVVVGGVVVPVLVLTCLLVISLPSLDDHARQSDATSGEAVIRVTAHRWWWEVQYGDGPAEAANEVHVPVGEQVVIELTSDDVIHSFWVPRLAGKTDAIPGTITRMPLTATEPGVFEGRCAEYCGLQHANMGFLVVAEEPAEHAAWLAAQEDDAAEPMTDGQREGEQVFLGSACVYCHAVRGTNALSDFGPDLTHLAGRQRIGGGILENNRGNLGGWLADPQHVKPGNLMPSLDLDSDELNVLLDYLESLE
jgi:cytochrome c oxidase subunit II